jgi:hypothetical protein
MARSYHRPPRSRQFVTAQTGPLPSFRLYHHRDSGHGSPAGQRHRGANVVDRPRFHCVTTVLSAPTPIVRRRYTRLGPKARPVEMCNV